LILTTTGLAIWIALLVVIAMVIVPLAVALLQRALKAARKIETYLADMLKAGVGIAGNTAAVPALDATADLVTAAKPVAEGIEAKTGAVAVLLQGRLARIAL
jgi:hypothetical protein